MALGALARALRSPPVSPRSPRLGSSDPHEGGGVRPLQNPGSLMASSPWRRLRGVEKGSAGPADTRAGVASPPFFSSRQPPSGTSLTQAPGYAAVGGPGFWCRA